MRGRADGRARIGDATGCLERAPTAVTCASLAATSASRDSSAYGSGLTSQRQQRPRSQAVVAVFLRQGLTRKGAAALSLE